MQRDVSIVLWSFVTAMCAVFVAACAPERNADIHMPTSTTANTASASMTASPPRRELISLRITESSAQGGVRIVSGNNSVKMYGMRLSDIISNIYNVTPSQIRGVGSKQQMSVDIELAGTAESSAMNVSLAESLQAVLGFKITETRTNQEVVVLRAVKGASAAISSSPDVRIAETAGSWRGVGINMPQVVKMISAYCNCIVVDETSFKLRYNITLKLPSDGASGVVAVAAMLGDEPAFDIANETRDVRMLRIVWIDESTQNGH